VLGSVGIGGGGAAAAGAAAGGTVVGGGVAAGIAKVAAVTVLAAGGTAVVVHEREAGSGPSPAPSTAAGQRDQAPTPAAPAVTDRSGSAQTPASEPVRAGRRGERRGQGRPAHAGGPAPAAREAPGQLKAKGERAHPVKPEQAASKGGNGRGPIEAPPKQTPVRRGPPEPKVNQQGAPPAQELPAKPDQAERHGPKLE
jgi:hypothetical protein